MAALINTMYQDWRHKYVCKYLSDWRACYKYNPCYRIRVLLMCLLVECHPNSHDYVSVIHDTSKLMNIWRQKILILDQNFFFRVNTYEQMFVLFAKGINFDVIIKGCSYVNYVRTQKVIWYYECIDLKGVCNFLGKTMSNDFLRYYDSGNENRWRRMKINCSWKLTLDQKRLQHKGNIFHFFASYLFLQPIYHLDKILSSRKY